MARTKKEPIDKILHYEDLVMDRIAKAFYAKDAGDDALFDEIIDEIEMLLKLIPNLYESYEREKEKLESYLEQALLETEKSASSLDDEILRRMYLTQKEAVIMWDFRNDILELILNTLHKYQMLPFAKPQVAELVEEELTTSTTTESNESSVKPLRPKPEVISPEELKESIKEDVDESRR